MAEQESKIHTVKVADVKVGSRFRKVFRDVESLAVSIQRFKQFCPIILDTPESMQLVDGERRLRAHKILNLEEIQCKFYGELDELERKEIELECNLQRQQFTWTEEVAGEAEIMTLKQARFGKAVKGMRVGFGIKELAEMTDKSIGGTHMDLKLAKGLKDHPEIAACKTKAAAIKMLEEMEMGRALRELASRAGSFTASSNIIHGDLRIELPKLAADSVDMVLADPQYGKDISVVMEADGEEFETVKFDDSKFNTKELLVDLLKESFRILNKDRCMLMFFDITLYQWLIDQAERVGFNVNKTPIVWYKTSGSGHPSHHSHYVPSYELILHLQKGYRKINTTTNNIIPYDRVPAKHKTHPTQKPRGLMKMLIENHTLLGELVVDPCCGTGSVIRAALAAKRLAWGCELNEDYYNLAQEELKKFLGEPDAQATKAPVVEDGPSSFKELVPGTEDWTLWWDQHPEDQNEMVAMARKLRGEGQEASLVETKEPEVML